MQRFTRHAALALILAATGADRLVLAQAVAINRQAILEVHNAITKPIEYDGKSGLEVRDAAPQLGDNAPRMVVIKDTTLRDGTIEVSLSGDTAPDAPANFRGFVGIAFHIGSDRAHYECIYLRPKNGRSADPVQRSHSTQYESKPDFPWDRLRNESPGKYESYVDLAPGDWTRVKIKILRRRALLFVNDAKEPTLVVNDLLGTADTGPIALWVGPGTIARFADLKVSRE
jgi:hypothetical protein